MHTGTLYSLMLRLLLNPTKYAHYLQSYWQIASHPIQKFVEKNTKTTCGKIFYIVCVQQGKIRTFNSQPNVYNEALVSIEDICLTIANKALVQLGMAASNRPTNNLFNRVTFFDVDNLSTFDQRNLPILVGEQRIIYDGIMHAITSQSRGLYFLDALGGTGKSFLI